jgi:hypothetical protein
MVVHTSSEAPRLPRSVCFRASGWHNQPPETIRHESRSRPGGRDAATKTSRPERLRSKDSSRRRSRHRNLRRSRHGRTLYNSLVRHSLFRHNLVRRSLRGRTLRVRATRTLRAPAISLSKTKKVAKLTSEISSSARITGAVFCVAIPPVAIEADAPPASDKAPATPNAVTALLRPFA